MLIAPTRDIVLIIPLRAIMPAEVRGPVCPLNMRRGVLGGIEAHISLHAYSPAATTGDGARETPTKRKY